MASGAEFLADVGLRCELEYGAVMVGPTVLGRPVQVSLLIEDQLGLRICPVCAIDQRTEAVKDSLLAFGGDPEHHAAARTAVVAMAIVGPAEVGRPVQRSLLVDDRASQGRCPIRAVVLRTEVVEDSLLACGSELEHVAGTGCAAEFGCTIQVSLLVEDQAGIGKLTIAAVAAALRTEAVEDGLFAFGSELEYDAAADGP
jgi:hypothetical protein